MLLILSDLGLTKDNPRIKETIHAWMKRFATEDGGFNDISREGAHLCMTGNTARALVKFGYVNHPRVKRNLDATSTTWFVLVFNEHTFLHGRLDSFPGF